MYVYQQTESYLWTVGFYDPSGVWHSDDDFSSAEEARQRVAWLNGSCLAARVDKLERELRITANTASCLANGIVPD